MLHRIHVKRYMYQYVIYYFFFQCIFFVYGAKDVEKDVAVKFVVQCAFLFKI